jgi:hypothetical protein
MGFITRGLGLVAWGLGLGAWGLGFRVWGFGCEYRRCGSGTAASTLSSVHNSVRFTLDLKPFTIIPNPTS